MKKPLACAVLLSAAILLGGAASAANSWRDALVGAWRLVSLEEARSDGKLQKADCTGMLVFTGDGHVSVQVMYRDAQPPAPAGSVQYAQGGYEATFGRFEVDEGKNTFTYHVEGSLVRTLVGKAFPRAYEFKGNQLIVRSANPAERWRAVWEHY